MNNRKNEAEARMCRLNGRKPTMRDRWRAFSRLWRLAHGHGAWQDMDATDCFRVLFSDWRPIRLMEGVGTYQLVNTGKLPTFLRRMMLKDHQRRRLYAGHYEWMDRDKKVANKVRDEHGIEVTPTEVAEVRRKVVNLARQTAAVHDFKLPPDDEDVLRLLKPKDNPAT